MLGFFAVSDGVLSSNRKPFILIPIHGVLGVTGGISSGPVSGSVLLSISKPPTFVYTNIGGISSGPISDSPISGIRKVATVASGPLIIIMDGLSNTVGTVQAYNDGIINIAQFTVDDPMPIRRACIDIITKAGLTDGVWLARPYKLNVMKNGAVIARIRSLYWGTKLTIDENNADWVVIDLPRFTDTLS